MDRLATLFALTERAVVQPRQSMLDFTRDIGRVLQERRIHLGQEFLSTAIRQVERRIRQFPAPLPRRGSESLIRHRVHIRANPPP
ncbi:MAG: hypothetical protein AB7F89_22715 [Pirellulaceae bacterium]